MSNNEQNRSKINEINQEQEKINNNLELDVDTNSKIKLQATAVICLCVVIAILVFYQFVKTDKTKEEPIKQNTETIISAKNRSFEIKNNTQIQDELEVKKDLEALFGLKEQNTTLEPAIILNTNENNKLVNKPRVLKSSANFSVNNSSQNTNKSQLELLDENIAQAQNLNNYYNDKIAEETNRLNLLMSNPESFNNNSNNLDFNNSSQNYSNNSSYQINMARINNINPHFLLSKGSFIHCSLNTRIVSMLAGNVSCTISNDVYSADGTVLLIDRGSTMFGSFKSGEISDGVNRLFVVWEEIRTPNNLIIPINSPATDGLGASGMSGYVDHQYLKRFGSAIFLSIIDDAVNVAINGKRGKDNVDYTENTRENARELANTALQEFIKIKPVLYKNQGEIVSVYVNKDVDFSKVYKLKMKTKIGQGYER
ncbi:MULTISPECIES: type IV secretion system protein VirB10 [unclassified Campylobacter]|uniref:type IV secretion system protein VirB10 n=1 Tax=unclassified Campylobacter TaxID=2593542 RepID=UPI001D5C3C70|nr:type IV secretion system protein VirB10 [Campylobacter sp. RM12651]MBZ7978535.1 type IV secretion system protein VirB10 [Campylobacter sp. RM12654]MBZ7980452.1 type IV secretion system protein VirB10 [Campylobacter sp. RM12642]MBZ7990611.1 type IV secretion system protein VirB10 [Campylobacter sp. RM9331]MBZ8004750.1 type IV secretion system protein VirB10 [Campylobacter sp. RM9332]MBZ8007133.1 type IV secretion system protein VirB10 [Campylobacter sp. RM9334]